MKIFQLRSFPRPHHLLWVVLFFVAARGGFYLLTDGFSPTKIRNTFPITDEWQLPPPSKKEQKRLQEICSKPFRYLGKGSQVYAFISDDGEHVLKLFKCYHLTPALWLEKIPLPPSISEMRSAALQKRNKKINDTLHSYKIASQKLMRECGLIAIEILPTPQFHQSVTLIDKVGREHSLDLGDFGFIIQQRADLIYPKLSRWIATDEIGKAKQALRSIVQLIVQRSYKGVQDSDPDLHKNAGLIDTKAIFIDLGSFHSNPAASEEEVYMRDLYKITNRLREWLEKQSPELALYLQRQIEDSPYLSVGNERSGMAIENR